MNDLRTFPKGGVHPHDNKEYTHHLAIRNATVPAEAVISMHQHMGAPAECVVQAGDEVREGMLIGRASGVFSSNVHCPVPGTVKEIKEIYLATGTKSKVVVVSLEGSFDQSGKVQQFIPWESSSPEELLKQIREMGIVGLGGATFPSPIKFTIREGAAVDCFIANGVECEPYLTADHRLMVEKSAEIVTGIRILQKILSPRTIKIGIEENKPDAIEAMRAAVDQSIEVADQSIEVADQSIEVVPLKMKYPQGDEKQLIKSITGREVPSGGLPLDIGEVVSNVGTLFAIFEAVTLNKPLIERIVTVSGSVIKTPANLKVRLGTKIGELIEDCGGFTETPAKLIAGGPMMGFALTDLDTPVTKGTSGIIALSRKEVGWARETPCISCGKCITVCPMGLGPTSLYKWIDHGEYQEALAEGLMDCKECGCCAFVCPAHIPLVQYMKLGKIMSRKKKA